MAALICLDRIEFRPLDRRIAPVEDIETDLSIHSIDVLFGLIIDDPEPESITTDLDLRLLTLDVSVLSAVGSGSFTAGLRAPEPRSRHDHPRCRLPRTLLHGLADSRSEGAN
jgi:hypothetical protein